MLPLLGVVKLDRRTVSDLQYIREQRGGRCQKICIYTIGHKPAVHPLDSVGSKAAYRILAELALTLTTVS
jgi:hypothetical protein